MNKLYFPFVLFLFALPFLYFGTKQDPQLKETSVPSFHEISSGTVAPAQQLQAHREASVTKRTAHQTQLAKQKPMKKEQRHFDIEEEAIDEAAYADAKSKVELEPGAGSVSSRWIKGSLNPKAQFVLKQKDKECHPVKGCPREFDANNGVSVVGVVVESHAAIPAHRNILEGEVSTGGPQYQKPMVYVK